MLPELHSILNLLEGGFSQLKVLVIGDIMLDRYIHGDVERISPEAPVPGAPPRPPLTSVAGGAANVAMISQASAARTFLGGFWGNDSEQSELATISTCRRRHRRRSLHLSSDHLQDPHCRPHPTAASPRHREPRHTPDSEARRLRDAEPNSSQRFTLSSSPTTPKARFRRLSVKPSSAQRAPQAFPYSPIRNVPTSAGTVAQPQSARTSANSPPQPESQSTTLTICSSPAGQALVVEHDLKFLTVT